MFRPPDMILLKLGSAILAFSLGSACAVAEDVDYAGLGRVATPEEVALWDIDVGGDGLGLPDGRGSVLDGEEIYIENCAACHGDFGEGNGRQPALIGGEGTLSDERPLKTVGSFWPYAGTLYDYVYRSMPFGNAQSLSADETYAVVAYVLNLNDIIGEDVVLDKKSLNAIRLPNRNGFVPDARPDALSGPLSGAPCMTDCVHEVSIMSRAQSLDVTPD